MADNTNRGRSSDRKRLNMGEKYEVAYAKSERASPARKALLAKGEATRSAGSAKNSAAKGSDSSAKRTGSGTKSSAAKRAAPSRAGKSAKSAKSSASPAMKRTNAEPKRKRALKATVRATPKPPKAEKTTDNTAPKTMKEADAVDLLTDDHLEVDTLFKKYEKLAKKEAPAGERKAVSQAICDMLTTHMTIEEEIFYPAARKAGIEADMLDEADIEHASAKDLIAQIEAGNPDDDHYDAKVKVLGEYITHHVVEEHTEMFPKCRRTGMDLVGLRAEMEARKMALVPEGSEEASGSAAATGDKGKSTGILAALFSTD